MEETDFMQPIYSSSSLDAARERSEMEGWRYREVVSMLS
jgi:hypothetical protein